MYFFKHILLCTKCFQHNSSIIFISHKHIIRFDILFSADFGLSKIIGSEVTTNTVCGTPGYCGE